MPDFMMVTQSERLPSPTDPAPRWTPLTLELPSGEQVVVRNDGYSDRIRCDHPDCADGATLGAALIAAAREHARGRVMILAPARLRAGLESAGLQYEATMPGYYCGEADCVTLTYPLDPVRATSSNEQAVAQVDRLVAEKPPAKPRERLATVRATVDDAEDLARLIAATFEHYPTPSGVPAYIAKLIEEGVPFRFVRKRGEMVACASADLVREAKTAELTDCSTRPDQRGGGFMQFILADLMDDMRAMGYPTAFTLARACIPGVNLAFQRLGFVFNGRMARSCRIGGGIEDMNVWSRRL
jgi:putative beta-lysine N-acetyltransferase